MYSFWGGDADMTSLISDECMCLVSHRCAWMDIYTLYTFTHTLKPVFYGHSIGVIYFIGSETLANDELVHSRWRTPNGLKTFGNTWKSKILLCLSINYINWERGRTAQFRFCCCAFGVMDVAGCDVVAGVFLLSLLLVSLHTFYRRGETTSAHPDQFPARTHAHFDACALWEPPGSVRPEQHPGRRNDWKGKNSREFF